ncbi:hypothetical protein CAXC1_180056 [Candidatus Xenohaliotis californiensis]|uniref:Uncharacterized protein n=1 Tax=Candidatus Xenohaliotis californiensis TaxID=84677 RepID=A0ABP0EWM7_9RICK|nr:hypothetical protein CAXC1_180056 [Candidatus Xenohaliotis californiensis]
MINTADIEKNIVLSNDTGSYNACVVAVPKCTYGGFMVPLENIESQLDNVFFAEHDIYFIGNDFHFTICSEGNAVFDIFSNTLFVSGRDYSGEFESFCIDFHSLEAVESSDSSALFAW